MRSCGLTFSVISNTSAVLQGLQPAVEYLILNDASIWLTRSVFATKRAYLPARPPLVKMLSIILQRLYMLLKSQR